MSDQYEKPLFCTETEFNYDEFCRMSKALQEQRRAYWTFMICFELVIIIFAIGYFLQSNRPMGLSFVILAVLFPLGMYLSQKQALKSGYKKAASRMEGVVTKFSFYENYFTAENRFSRSRVFYKDLKDVIFTERNIYLLIEKTKAYIIDTEGSPDGLVQFISKIADHVLPRKTRRPRPTDFMN